MRSGDFVSNLAAEHQLSKEMIMCYAHFHAHCINEFVDLYFCSIDHYANMLMMSVKFHSAT